MIQCDEVLGSFGWDQEHEHCEPFPRSSNRLSGSKSASCRIARRHPQLAFPDTHKKVIIQDDSPFVNSSNFLSYTGVRMAEGKVAHCREVALCMFVKNFSMHFQARSLSMSKKRSPQMHRKTAKRSCLRRRQTAQLTAPASPQVSSVSTQASPRASECAAHYFWGTREGEYRVVNLFVVDGQSSLGPITLGPLRDQKAVC